MKRLLRSPLSLLYLLLGLSTVLNPLIAEATTYYIRSDGHDGASGQNNTADATTGAWQHLSQANSTVQPGDVVQVVSLTASDTTTGVIDPANAATQPITSFSQRITYIGAIPADPTQLPTPASLAGFTIQQIGGTGIYVTPDLYRTGVTVKGFRVNNQVSIACKSYLVDAGDPAPQQDSVAYCMMPGFLSEGATDCMVYKCFLRDPSVDNPRIVSGVSVAFHGQAGIKYPWYCNGGPQEGCPLASRSPAYRVSSRDTLRGCRIAFGTLNCQEAWSMDCDPNYVVIDSNTVTGTYNRWYGSNLCGNGTYPFDSYRALGTQFKDNNWTFDLQHSLYPTDTTAFNSCPVGSCGANVRCACNFQAFILRDSTSFNSFTRDTFSLGSSGSSFNPAVLEPSAAGTYTNTSAMVGNRFAHCVIRTTGGVFLQNGAYDFAMDTCLVVCDTTGGPGYGTAITVGTTTNGATPWGGGSRFRHNTIIGENTAMVFNCSYDGTGEMYDNIFYADSTLGGGIVQFDGPPPPAGISGLNTNLFWARNGSVSPSDGKTSTVGFGGTTGRIGPAGAWCSTYEHDCNSLYGNPCFKSNNPNVGFSLSGFDAGISGGADKYNNTSLAIGLQWGGSGNFCNLDKIGYAGWIAPTDTVPPDTVTFTEYDNINFPGGWKITSGCPTPNGVDGPGWANNSVHIFGTATGGDHETCILDTLEVMLIGGNNGVAPTDAQLAAQRTIGNSAEYRVFTSLSHGQQWSVDLCGCKFCTNIEVVTRAVDKSGNASVTWRPTNSAAL